MPKQQYTISEEERRQFAGVFILENIVTQEIRYSVALSPEDAVLEPIFDWLFYTKGYVDVGENNSYVATEKGRKVLKQFMARYIDFVRVFDVYSAVDLEQGTFAFSRHFDFEEEEDWEHFLHQEHWEDLRIAVAQFKSINPIDIVFMSFVNDGRIDPEQPGWQADLASGVLWDEISEICGSALHIDDFGYADEDGPVDGKDVILDIIRQGAELNVRLKKQEKELEDTSEADSEPRDSQDDLVEEYTIEHYESYVDPFYVSPVWLGLWLI